MGDVLVELKVRRRVRIEKKRAALRPMKMYARGGSIVGSSTKNVKVYLGKLARAGS